jgi:hypothetical protein
MTSPRNKVLLSLAGLAVFIFLAAGSTLNRNSNSNSNSDSKPAPEKASTTTYQNSSGRFVGKLQDYYVNFTFDYPSTWKRDGDAGKGTSPNFVKLERRSNDDITLENFAVGYFTGQKELMQKLAAQLSNQLKPGFPGYRKVSEGPTTVGSYDGYEFRFTAHSDKSARGDLDIWGRAILLPGTEDRKGAVLLMLATSASSEVKGVDDVGEKGELPIILNSFKFTD